MKKNRVTTLDYAILGLLLAGPMSGYEIRKVFETTAMGNYSSSPGSIYPAIKKLVAAGFIKHEYTDTHRNGQYFITDDGRLQIKSWLVQSFDKDFVAKNTNVLLLKFAFMDHLVSHEEKIRFLENFRDVTEAYLQDLNTYHLQQGHQLPLHGRLSFEYGISTFQTQLTWAQSTLQTISNLKPS